MSDALTLPVVPYVIYRGYTSPIEVLPDPPDTLLNEIASSHLGVPAVVRIQKRPIRTDDEIEIASEEEAQIQIMAHHEALREEDMLPPPPTPKAVPAMQEVKYQAPPRPKSREMPIPWEIQRRAPEEFMRPGDRVPVILEEMEGIQEPTKRKVFLRPIRDVRITVKPEHRWAKCYYYPCFSFAVTDIDVFMFRKIFSPPSEMETRI
jgi:hypothetical protein